ncbi:hypothetical protein BDV18DRAFT_160642 [Aspergillus unguis]
MYAFRAALPTLFALSANALFDCNENQKAFDPVDGKFVVHFTDSIDSHYNGNEPWIRICLPNDSGSWDNVDPLGIPCSTTPDKTFGPGETGLKSDLTVGLGGACDKNGGYGYLQYGSVIVNLMGDYSNGDVCGARYKGISCQFDL